MRRVVITSFARTAVGAYCSGLKTVPVEELAALVVKEALKRSEIRETDVDGIILGQVIPSADVPNLARTAALLNGMEGTPGLTVNQMGASGIQAIISATQQILTGGGDIIVAGGAETLSNIPYYLPKSVRHAGFYTNAAQQSLYPMMRHMAHITETIVTRYNIPREDQDVFAYNSQIKTKEAMDSSRFTSEIIPVEVKAQNTGTIFGRDENPRPNTTLKSLAKLKPLFKEGGSVTLGNSSGASDGAAALVLMAEEKSQEMGLKPLAYIVDYAVTAFEPGFLGLGSASAIQKLLKKSNLTLDDIDLLEINENFAGQILGCMKKLGIYLDSHMYQRLNVNGGGVSQGHPLGCSGARITGTLAYELQLRQGRYGISSACAGGGQGVALLIERTD